MNKRAIVKKVISTILAIELTVSLNPLSTNNRNVLANTNAYSGTVGENITWDYDENTQTLSFDGEGKLDYSSQISQFSKPIKTIKIGKDINYISVSNFEDNETIQQYIVEDGNEVYCTKDGVIYDKNEEKIIKYPSGVDNSQFKVPETVKEIGKYAFSSSKKLQNIILNKSINNIEGYAFSNSGLTSIDFNFENKCKLGGGLFSKCKNLNAIRFVAGIDKICVEDIGNENVKYIFIGADVNDIDIRWASSSLPVLESIDVDTNNNYYSSKDNLLYKDNGRVLLLAPRNLQQSEIYFPERVAEIGEEAFECNRNIKKIYCNKSLKQIDSSAFSGCENLEKIYLNNGLEVIGTDAFSDTGLSTVLIPESVKEIENAFTECNIMGKPNSIAKKYAEEKGLPFDSVDSKNEIQDYENDDDVWNGKDVEEIIPNGNIYVISNAAQLNWISQKSNRDNWNFAGKKLILSCNIDMSGYDFVPICSGKNGFMGSFDGKKHIISNLKIKSDANWSGLFGRVTSYAGRKEYIRNISIRGIEIKDGKTSGGIAGLIWAKKRGTLNISNCTVSGKITGNVIGGVIGEIYHFEKGSNINVVNCSSSSSLITGNIAAGIVGIVTNAGYDTTFENLTRLEKCSFSGSITAGGMYGKSAGIVFSTGREDEGKGKTEIRECVSEGTMKTGRYVNHGGIIGETVNNDRISYVYIYGCVNRMSVDGAYNCGGIIGTAGEDVNIEECCNEGYVMTGCTGADYGGIAGQNNGKISNCYNSGKLGTGNFVYGGGIAGINNHIIQNCYNNGRMPQTLQSSTYISAPGAMSAINSGTIVSSYFDLDLIPVNYLLGSDFVNDKNADRTVRTEGDSIIHSGGMSYDDMKNESNYLDWDFKNVWTFDPECSNGYPIPYILRDKVTKLADDEMTSQIDSEKIFVKVVDSNGIGIRDVSVQYASKKAKTNKFGIVSFKKNKTPEKISASKSGYIEYSVDDFEVRNDFNEYKIYLRKIDDTSKFDLKSAIIKYNGIILDLLVEQKQINVIKKDTKFSIESKLAYKDTKISKFQLVQNEKIISESIDGKFEISNGDFVPNEAVFIQVIGEQNNIESRTRINLDVIEVKEQEFTKLKLGKKVEFKVNNDVPLLEGTTFEFGTDDLPINMVISDKKWHIGVNINKLKLRNAEKDENFLWSMRNAESCMQSGYTDYLQYMDKPGVTLGKNPKITLNILGYAEGELPWDNSKKIDIDVSGILTIKGGIEKQIQYYVVGCTLEGSVGVDGAIEFKIKKDKKFSMKEIKLEIGSDLSLFLGTGLSGVGTLGVYGNGKIDTNYILGGKDETTGLQSMKIAGSMGVKAKIGDDESFISLLDNETYLYNRDTNLNATEKSKIKSKSNYSKNVMKKISKANYSQIARSTNNLKSNWMMEENTSINNAVCVQKNAYLGLIPKVVKSGNDIIMIFTSDDESQRADNDKSMLMYSIYDRDKQSWGIPKAVCDDKTADFNPKIASDGINTYVVWNNEKSLIKANTGLTDKYNNTEVMIAKYNNVTHTFGEPEQITDNNAYENSLNIAINNGKVIVYWTENSNNLWRTTGTNKVYIATRNNAGWNKKLVASIQDEILLDKVVYTNNEPYYAYVDGNNKYKQISLTDLAVHFEKDDISTFESIKTLNGNKILFVDKSGNIRIENMNSNKDEIVCHDFSGSITDVITDDNGRMAILYTVNENNKSDAYIITYDRDLNKWSKPIQVTEQDKYVENITGVFDGSNIITAFNQREVILDRLKEEKNNLYSLAITQKMDLSLEDININDRNIVAGGNVPVKMLVKNNGTESANNVKIILKDKEQTISEQYVETEVLPGERKEILSDVKLPLSIENQEYTIQIADTTTNDANIQDNEKIINLGKAVLSLETVLSNVNGNYSLALQITNSGYSKANGELIIFDANNEENIFCRYSLAKLKAQSKMNLFIDINKYIKKYGQERVGAKIVGDKVLSEKDLSDIKTIYNKEYVEVKNIDILQSELNLTNEDEQYVLNVDIFPIEADNKKITWKSSNEYAATVSDTGVVTAHHNGNTIITASDDSGEVFDTCYVKVDLPVQLEDICFEEEIYEIEAGEIYSLQCVAIPRCAELGDIEWTSSDTDVAKIFENGKVVGVKEGEAIITAREGKHEAKCKIKVKGQNENNDLEIVKKYTDISTDNMDDEINKTWIYHLDNEDAFRVTIDDDSELPSYGKVYIYDEANTLLRVLNGDEIAGTQIYVEGSFVKITIKCDYFSKEYYAFNIKSIDKCNKLRLQSIQFEKQELSIEKSSYKRYDVRVNIYPEDLKPYVNLKWECSNSNISLDFDTTNKANLSNYIKGIEIGDSIIKVSQNEIFAECKVHVTDKVVFSGEIVHVQNVSQLESEHNYKDNLDKMWIYTKEGATNLNVSFSKLTEVEEDYDYIYIYDCNDYQIGMYTGTQLAGKTIKVSGNTIKVRLVSDESSNHYGFKVVSITDGQISNDNNVNNNYNGISNRYSYSNVLKVKKPQIVKVKSVKNIRGRKLRVTWKKTKNVSGYVIMYAENKRFTKNKKKIIVKNYKTTKKTLSKLKIGNKYYIRVKSYKIYNNKKIYGGWSKIKKIIIRK